MKTNKSEKIDEVAFSSFFVRKEQAVAIALGLKNSEFIKKLKMRRCGLNDEKFLEIITNLDPYTVRSIDISYNPLLTAQSYVVLANYILDPRCMIISLNFEGNNLKDRNI